jgi:multidrug efflux system membrane fusion protein
MIKRGNVPVIKRCPTGRRLTERYVTGRTVTGGWPWACGAVALLIAGSFAAGCAKQQAAAPPRAAVPVVVAKVTQKAMPVQVTAIGNVEPYSTISIRAQVAGELLEVHFQEGDSVRKGQLLLTIDPRPYEAALAQAQAQLARDKAVAANGRAEAQRYQQLLDAGIAAREQVEQLRSSAEAGESVVTADEAAIKTAELNLEYCTIKSPIDGRTGALMVKAGNLVKVADVPIVVINQVNPIYVDFTVPQQYLPDVKRYMAQGSLHVLATVPDDPAGSEEGTLTFVDNAVDPTTGTIHLKATFTNARNSLWPGVYVNTTLTLSQQAAATVVPLQAIVASQKGPSVYVVKSDGTVESRPVVSPRTVEGEAVVDKGLQPGETVVTDGQARLIPGAKVEITNAAEQADPAASPAPKRARAKSVAAPPGNTSVNGPGNGSGNTP